MALSAVTALLVVVVFHAQAALPLPTSIPTVSSFPQSATRMLLYRSQRGEVRYRERRRHGLVLVSLEVGPRQIAALERLALLDVDDRDKASIAWAVSRFLDAAPHLAALPVARARAYV